MDMGSKCLYMGTHNFDRVAVSNLSKRVCVTVSIFILYIAILSTQFFHVRRFLKGPCRTCRFLKGPCHRVACVKFYPCRGTYIHQYDNMSLNVVFHWGLTDWIDWVILTQLTEPCHFVQYESNAIQHVRRSGQSQALPK